jgi:hypothetical protein
MQYGAALQTGTVSALAILMTIFVFAVPASGAMASSTADHGKFEQLKGSFETGPEVTRACLTCHTEAARQIQQTMHWTWEPSGAAEPGTGKRRMINNY